MKIRITIPEVYSKTNPSQSNSSSTASTRTQYFATTGHVYRKQHCPYRNNQSCQAPQGSASSSRREPRHPQPIFEKHETSGFMVKRAQQSGPAAPHTQQKAMKRRPVPPTEYTMGNRHVQLQAPSITRHHGHNPQKMALDHPH